jgi:hypothetical protein
LLKSWLQAKAEEQRAKNTALPRSTLRGKGSNKPLAVKKMQRRGDAIAEISQAPEGGELR